MIGKGMTVERFALVDDDGNQKASILSLGKNIIGRGSVELKGISYVEISSPNCSVSRVQANIEICPNGDAWICDCNSTNGTFLAVNRNSPRNAENEMDHLGICLKEKYYYQLSEGCRITFGDVTRVFKRISVPEEKLDETEAKEEKQEAHLPERNELEIEEKRASRISADLKTSSDLSSGPNTHPNNITSTIRNSHQNEGSEGKMKLGSCVGHDVHLPYLSSDAEDTALLASSPAASTTMSVSRSTSATTTPATTVAAVGSRRGKKTTTAAEAVEVGAGAGGPREGGLEQHEIPRKEYHRSRSTPSSSSCSAPGTKKYRREEVQPAGRSKYSVSACLSGMEESEREEAKKAVKKVGKVIDDITKASVLIVRLPAVRTPKFIIAVGRGIPVVGLEGFKEWSAGSLSSDAEDHLLKHVVSLSHGKTEYSSALLRQCIAHRRGEKNKKKDGDAQEGRGLAPALDGYTFSLGDVPAKVKEVAADIITGCGGKVFGSRGRRKAGTENSNETVIPITGEAGLGAFYDRILRGNVDFQNERKT